MNVNEMSLKDFEAVAIAQRLKQYCDTKLCGFCPFCNNDKCIINVPCKNFGNIPSVLEVK